jgi:hypothetical protein
LSRQQLHQALEKAHADITRTELFDLVQYLRDVGVPEAHQIKLTGSGRTKEVIRAELVALLERLLREQASA